MLSAYETRYQRKANDMSFSIDVTAKLLSHIFGTKSGPTFFEGLVDCNSESEFETKLQLVEEKWRYYEELRPKCAGHLAFFDWFKKYHAEEIKCSMLRSVRQAAGLGDPLSQYCTNDSEAINSAVKQYLKFKKSDWPTFNEKMKKYVTDQQEEVCKAIIGTGQYVLKKQYIHLAVSSHQWFTTFTAEQKDCARKKFQKAIVRICEKGVLLHGSEQHYQII